MQVRTYAPFERGWLLVKLETAMLVLRVRTYAPFERGWLPNSGSNSIIAQSGQDLRPV